MYGCQNCGAMLRYDIALRMLKCDHCDSTFDVQSFSDQSLNKSEYEAHIFECPQCGGEIYTQDNDLTGRCSYCGNTQVFKSRVETIKKPRWIIPFTEDKEACKRAYSSAAKKAIFAPSALKQQDYIDSIRGIYMPYWFYDCYYHKDIMLRGIQNGSITREGNNLRSKIISVHSVYDAQFLAMLDDASSWYSDEISENVRPFYMKQGDGGMRPFNPAYMCGFYGETADVDKPDDDIIKSLNKEVGEKSRTYVYDKGNEKLVMESGMEQAERPTRADAELGLLPVWFLSYNKGKKVSYSVINGQTGRLSVEFPIDMKKYLACTAGVAVILFLILNLFWVMRPEYIALAAAIGAVWGIKFAKRDIREIAVKEIAIASPHKRKYVDRLKRLEPEPFKVVQCIPYVLVVLLVIMENSGFVDRHPFGVMVLLPIVLTVWAAIRASIDVWGSIKKSHHALRYLEHGIFPGYIFAYVSIIIALAVQIIRPVSDMIYFGVSFLCMAMTMISFISLIGAFNRMATRRMPQFDHRGGDDSAKNP